MAGKQSWTDEQLRRAVASSTSYVQTLKTLGLSGRGGAHYSVKHRVAELGLDTSHFRGESVATAHLREAVARSSSFPMVLEKLGLPVTSATCSKYRRRAKVLGLDASHFVGPGRLIRRATRWDDAQLRDAVAAAPSIAAVLRALGLVAAGGNYDQVQRRIRELELDTSHMTRGAWTRDRKPPGPVVALSEVLVAGRATASHKLKQRLFRSGLKAPVCELCGWAQCAEDGRVPVELDHINGDRDDNRLENLRVLCPNCHALQPTHRGLNQRRRQRAG